MRRLDRYFAGEFVRAFALALIGLVVVFLSMSILEAMRIESRQPKHLLYLHLAYGIPQTMVFVTPAAVMFSVCFTVAQFTMARELVATFASGISFYRSTAGIYVFALALSMGLIFFQNFAVIPANRASQEYLDRYKKNSKKKVDVVWQKSVRGKHAFYFMQFFDRETNEVKGGFHVLLLRPGSDKPERMLEAKSARHVGGHQWNLSIVRETLFDEELNIVGVKPHMTYPLEVEEDISFFLNPMRNPAEMDIFELREEIRLREAAGLSAVPYQIHLHATLAFPFMCFIIAVVGAIAGNMGSLRSGGPLIRSLLLSTATIFFFQVSIQLGQNLGENGILPPWVAGWGATMVFAGVAAVLVRRHRR